jgi:hypothetical protein
MELLATRYSRLRTEMRLLRDGLELAAAADAVEAALPERPVVLVSTSDEGAALAAVCAARRGDGNSWLKVNLLQPQSVAIGSEVVVVEPVDAGAAWRQAVEYHYPTARVLILSELRTLVPVAA